MAAPKIEKLLTPYNFTNKDSVGRIKYIVIHYVGALGGAKANCQYYASKYIGASAHYFVGFDGEIWQSVPDEDIAWHCGASSYKHAECRNANSIGIELCVRNKGSQADTSKDWYFEDATVKAAIELTKYLMQKYGVPASHVIRHYDVTGKICPNPYVYNTTKHTWDAFKKAMRSWKAGYTGRMTLYGMCGTHPMGSGAAAWWSACQKNRLKGWDCMLRQRHRLTWTTPRGSCSRNFRTRASPITRLRRYGSRT